MTACPICKGALWVCEDHPFHPFGGESKCPCGSTVGKPCDCNPGADLPASYVSIASTYPDADGEPHG